MSMRRVSPLLLLAVVEAARKAEEPKGPIHTTIGVYPRPDRYLWKINGVAEENLEEHIAYNKLWRFGRALFVDGKCVYPGRVAPEDIARIEAELEAEPIVLDRDTAPYR